MARKRLERIADIESFQVPKGFELVERAGVRYTFNEINVGDNVLVLSEMSGKGKGIYLTKGQVVMADFDARRSKRYITVNPGHITMYPEQVNGIGKVYRKKR